MSTADVIAARDVLSSWIRSAAANVSSTATFVPPACSRSTSGVSTSGNKGCLVIMKPCAIRFLIPNCR
jgi:hypothetical protein